MSNLRPSGLRIVTVRDFDGLVSHLTAWDRLAWDAPQAIPTLLPAWVDAFLRHRLKPDKTWFCSFVYADEELIGVLPVIVAPHPVLGRRWPLLCTPFDEFTPSGDILLASDYATAAFQALLVEVGRQIPGHLGLDLKAVHPKSSVWTALQGDLDGYAIYRGLLHLNSVIDVRGDFDDYLASLGKLRRNMKRYGKKLEGRGTVSVEIRKGSAAGEDFLAEFLALEASGWKGRNGTAILNNPSAIAFYSTLVTNCAAQGRWEWHVIRVQDRIVAAGMGVRCGASLMLPKIAFDEDFADSAPGSLLTKEVIKDAFQNQELTQINHMSNASWHNYWRMTQEEYVNVHLLRRSAAAVLLHLPRLAARSAYQDYVRPHIPTTVKEAYRKYMRRGGHKLTRCRRIEPLP